MMVYQSLRNFMPNPQCKILRNSQITLSTLSEYELLYCRLMDSKTEIAMSHISLSLESSSVTLSID